MGATGDIYFGPAGPEHEAAQAARSDRLWIKSRADFEDYLKQLYELEDLDDPALAKQAVDRARGDNPDFDNAALKPVAKAMYDSMRTDRDRKKVAIRQAITAAVASGGGAFLPEDLLSTEAQTEAIKQSKPWKRTETQALLELARESDDPTAQSELLAGNVPPDLAERYNKLRDEEIVGQGPLRDRGPLGWASYLLSSGGRGSAGAAAATLSKLQEVAGETKPQETSPARATAGEIARRIIELGLSASPAVAIPNAITKAITGSDVIGGAGEAARGAIESGRVLGVPVVDAALGVAKQPQAIPGLVAAQAKGFVKGLTGEPDDAASLEHFAYEQRRRLAQRAAEDARARVAQDPRLDLKAEAKRLFDDYVTADAASFGLRNPEAAQTAAEIALDPVNVAPFEKVAALVGRGAKGAASAAERAAPGVAAWVKENLRAAPEAADIGGRAGSLMRMAEDQARQLPETFRDEALPLLERIKKAPNQALLMAAREGRASLPPAFAHAYEDPLRAAGELSDLMQKYRERTGLGNVFREEGLAGAKGAKLEGYVPHRILKSESEKAYDLTTAILEKKRTKVLPASTLARQAKSTAFKQNAYEQYVAGIGDLASRMEAASNIKDTFKYLHDEGLAERYLAGNAPGTVMSGGKSVSTKKELLRLQEKTGRRWVALEPALNEVVHRITGGVGLKRGELIHIVPEPAKRLFDKLAPIVTRTPATLSGAVSAYNAVQAYALRPFMGTFRAGVTTLGGLPHLARNMVSAIALGAVNLGLRAASINLQRPAIAAALAAAGLGSAKGRALEIALESGDKMAVGEILDFLKSAGALHQFSKKMALNITGKGPLDYIRRGTHWLAEHSSPVLPGIPALFGRAKAFSNTGLNNIVENYQKLLHFIATLKGRDTASLAQALDRMSELAGNYERLSSFEKTVVRDFTSFYAWNRFVMPLLTKQLVQHPDRFALFAKGRGYAERRYGKENPAWEALAPDYMRDLAYPAPGTMQPTPRGAHQVALMTTEDPLSMLFQPLAQILEGGKLGGIKSMLAPTVLMGMELMTGVDAETGEELPDMPWDPGELSADLRAYSIMNEVQSSSISQALLSPIRRVSRYYHDIGRLLFNYGANPGDALDHMMRYRAGRDLSVLGVFSQGAEGSPIPGVSTYPADLYKEAALRQNRANESAKQVNQAGRRRLPWE